MEQISRRLDKKESKFLNRAIKMKFDDPKLDCVPKFFIQMDRTIKPSLEKLMGKGPELRDEMIKAKLELAQQKKSITKICKTALHILSTRGLQ